jgi:hypothetical protein
MNRDTPAILNAPRGFDISAFGGESGMVDQVLPRPDYDKERPARASAEVPLSVEIEDALGVAGEECGFGGSEIESVKSGNAFSRWPERVVRAEQNAMPCIAAHVID